MHQIVFSPPQTPLGELTSKGRERDERRREGKGKEGRGREGEGKGKGGEGKGGEERQRRKGWGGKGQVGPKLKLGPQNYFPGRRWFFSSIVLAGTRLIGSRIQAFDWY